MNLKETASGHKVSTKEVEDLVQKLIADKWLEEVTNNEVTAGPRCLLELSEKIKEWYPEDTKDKACGVCKNLCITVIPLKNLNSAHHAMSTTAPHPPTLAPPPQAPTLITQYVPPPPPTAPPLHAQTLVAATCISHALCVVIHDCWWTTGREHVLHNPSESMRVDAPRGATALHAVLHARSLRSVGLSFPPMCLGVGVPLCIVTGSWACCILCSTNRAKPAPQKGIV